MIPHGTTRRGAGKLTPLRGSSTPIEVTLPMRGKFIALALTAVVAAGCDKTTDPTSSLTPSEIRAIVLAVDDAGLEVVNQHQSGSPYLNLTPTRPSTDILEHSGSFSFSGECDLGGTAGITGTGSYRFDTEAPTIDVGLDATATYSACRFESDDDVEIALTGAVVFGASRHAGVALVSGTQSYAGSLEYDMSNGKQGTCLIDIEADFSLQQGAASRSITGSVCSQSVDVTQSWTANS